MTRAPHTNTSDAAENVRRTLGDAHLIDIYDGVVGRKHLAAPSVDRIDSNKHYTPDNIQIVMWAVNNNVTRPEKSVWRVFR